MVITNLCLSGGGIKGIAYIGVIRILEELDILSGKKILLTGGAGFLGYEFTHLFSKVGFEDDREPIHLTIYDNFNILKKYNEKIKT